MAGTKLGGMKTAKTNKDKYGPDFYSKIGKIGGANGRGHKFAHGKLDPSETGKLGIGISKRRKV